MDIFPRKSALRSRSSSNTVTSNTEWMSLTLLRKDKNMMEEVFVLCGTKLCLSKTIKILNMDFGERNLNCFKLQLMFLERNLQAVRKYHGRAAKLLLAVS